MKTIEEMGELAHRTWQQQLGKHLDDYSQVWVEVAKAIIAALDEGVSWAVGDDE